MSVNSVGGVPLIVTMVKVLVCSVLIASVMIPTEQVLSLSLSPSKNVTVHNSGLNKSPYGNGAKRTNPRGLIDVMYNFGSGVSTMSGLSLFTRYVLLVFSL